MYGADSFLPEERIKFFEWYEQQKDKIFNFREELESYCRSDVDILQRSCMKFRQLMIDITGRWEEKLVNGERVNQFVCIDPFLKLTIASVAMSIYRGKFLTEEYDVTLKECPDKVYKGQLKDGKFMVNVDGQWISGETLNIASKVFVKSPMARVCPTKSMTHSKMSIAWLEWEAQRRGIHIQHALNAGEYTVPNREGNGRYRLDGFHEDPQTGKKTVFEFYGCVWHGCPTCFPENRTVDPSNVKVPLYERLRHPHTGQCMSELYLLTKEREKYLKEVLQCEIVIMWEHQFHQQLRTDDQLQDFIDRLNIPERLDPRSAFFGRRTDCCHLYHQVAPGETISYSDGSYCSEHCSSCSEHCS